MVFASKGYWFRRWACADHLDGLTGSRQFGAPYEPHPVTAGRSAYPSSPASGTCEHANGGDGPRRNKRPPASLRRTQFRTDASKVWRCRFCFPAPRRQPESPVRRPLTTTAATSSSAGQRHRVNSLPAGFATTTIIASPALPTDLQ
jgi:hypothetical protein